MSLRLRKDSDLRKIIEPLAQRHDLPSLLVKDIVAGALDLILQVTDEQGRLQLRGFGVFRKKVFAPKVGRNPRTGATVEVPSRTRLVFLPEITRERVSVSRESADGNQHLGPSCGAQQAEPLA